MFSKLSLSLILTASLACVAQVSTAGGYGTASATPMTAPVAPVVSTPGIALPGSGPAVGAPLTNANDPRFSTGPSIANPNFSVSGAEGGSLTATPPISANEGFEFGVQHVLSGGPAGPTPTASLAEIALLVRARHPKAQKSFTNDSIAKLNAAGVRTGNLGPESSTAPPSTELAQAPSADTSLVAENRIPALPQSDQAETQVRPPQNSAIAAQQRHRVESPAETTASSPAPASTPASSPRDQAEGAARLPQTSSSLPIILLLGALGIAGGALFYFIRR